MKTTYGISNELQYVNLKEILENYKNHRFWKKKWCVFKTKDFEIFWKITSIDVDNDYITSRCKVEYHGKHRVDDPDWFWNSAISETCSSIPISNSDYTQEVFNRNICGTVATLITKIEERIAKNSYDYKLAGKLEKDAEDRLRKIAEDFLDSEGVTNKDIREAYIDKYVSENSRFPYKSNVIAESKRKYYPTARLMLFSWFDNKKSFDEETILLRETKKLTKKIIYEIWRTRKELESDAWREEMESKLEAI